MGVWGDWGALCFIGCAAKRQRNEISKSHHSVEHMLSTVCHTPHQKIAGRRLKSDMDQSEQTALTPSSDFHAQNLLPDTHLCRTDVCHPSPRRRLSDDLLSQHHFLMVLVSYILLFLHSMFKGPDITAWAWYVFCLTPLQGKALSIFSG